MKDAVGTQVEVGDLVAATSYNTRDVLLGKIVKILGMSNSIDVEVIANAHLGGALVYQTGKALPVVRLHRAHVVKTHEQVRVPS